MIHLRQDGVGVDDAGNGREERVAVQLCRSLRAHPRAASAAEDPAGRERCAGEPGPGPVLDPIWVSTVFTENRDRLLTTEMTRKLMAAFLAYREVAPLSSDNRFSVEGTLVKAWASMKSFQPMASDTPPVDDPAACWDPMQPRKITPNRPHLRSRCPGLTA